MYFKNNRIDIYATALKYQSDDNYAVNLKNPLKSIKNR